MFIWLPSALYGTALDDVVASYRPLLIAGLVALLAALAWCVILFWRRRLGVHALTLKPISALAFVLAAPALMLAVGVVYGSPIPLTTLAVSGRVALVLITVGLVLGVLALVERGKSSARFASFRLAAVAVVLGASLGIVGVYAAYQLVQDVVARLPESGNENRPPLVFEKLNFRFAHPGDLWRRVESASPGTALAFDAQRPRVAFEVIAEPMTAEQEVGPAMLREAAIENLRTSWPEVTVRRSEPYVLNGVAGERMIIDVAGDEGRLTYVLWLAAKGGHVYQLQLYSDQTPADELEKLAERMLDNFSVLDHRPLIAGRKPIEDFYSSRYGYRVRLKGTPWQRWENLAEVMPDAEFGAMMGANARALVVPVSFLGREPRLEATTAALLARFGIAFPTNQATNFRGLHGEQGHRFEVTREVSGRSYTYRFQVVQQAGRGYLVAAWADKSAPEETIGRLDDFLDRFGIVENPGPPLTVADLNAQEKSSHAQLFNDLGRYYFNARLFAESNDYFRQAVEVVPNDPVVLVNVITSYRQLNQFQQAHDYLERHLPNFATNLELKAQHAFLQGKLNDTEAALRTYAELFRAGYRDDAAFEDYVMLLADHQRIDEALAQASEYLLRGESLTISRLKASLHSRKGEHQQAISLLTKLQQGKPFDAEIAYDLANVYLDAGHFQDGLTMCQQLLDRQFATPYAYYLKGRHELGLRWYSAAKASFEAALKQEPSHQDAQKLLEQVSGILGEGSNTLVKQPIEAVSIPKELLDLPDTSTVERYQSKYGACYLQRITAVEFANDRELRTTTRQLVKLLDPSGVTRFSTFEVDFDPLREQLYVNLLRVVDEHGKEVAFGKASDYYVIDEAADEMATQRKLLNVPVPGLRPGYTVEFVVTRRELSPPAHFPFTEHLFAADLPVLNDYLYVTAGEGEVAARPMNGVVEQPLAQGRAWTRSTAGIYRREPMQAPLETFLPYVLLGSPRRQWDQLVAEYLKSIADRLEIEPSTRKLAERVVADAKSDDEKVATLVRLVQDQLTYKAIEFGRRAQTPNKGSTILANRYGDCKDHSLLLMQLLESAGIEARLALVRSDGSFDRSLAALDQFDHMIVYLPQYRSGCFLDATDKEWSLESVVPRGLAGKVALILDREDPRFVDLPAYPDDSNQIESQRVVKLVNQTDMTIEETLRLTGYHAATLRGLFKGIQPADRAATLQIQLAAGGGVPLEVQKVEIDNLDEKAMPLVVRTTYVVKSRFHAVEDALVGQVPALWERFFLKAEPVANRQTPFIVRYPLRVKSTIELALPQGYTSGDMNPLNREERSAFAEWKVSAERKDQALEVQYEVSRTTGNYQPEQYEEYCSSIERAVGALAHNLVLKRTVRK